MTCIRCILKWLLPVCTMQLAQGDFFELVTRGGEVLGAAVLTNAQARNPVFVSVGSGLSLSSALHLVNRFSNHRWYMELGLAFLFAGLFSILSKVQKCWRGGEGGGLVCSTSGPTNLSLSSCTWGGGGYPSSLYIAFHIFSRFSSLLLMRGLVISCFYWSKNGSFSFIFLM